MKTTKQETEYRIGRLDPDGKLDYVFDEEPFVSKEDAVRHAAFSMGEVVVARPAPEPYVIVSYGDETEEPNA